MTFMVIQIAPGLNPRDPNVPQGPLNKMGSFVPVSADGYYSNAECAHEVADYLAEEYPHLQTLVVEVVVGNDSHRGGRDGSFPPLPWRVHEAPPAYEAKAQERAKMTPQLRYQIIRRDGYRCRACGFAVQDGAQLHVDHIMPVSKGGATKKDNLQTLCWSCNTGKGTSS